MLSMRLLIQVRLFSLSASTSNITPFALALDPSFVFKIIIICSRPRLTGFSQRIHPVFNRTSQGESPGIQGRWADAYGHCEFETVAVRSRHI